MEDLRSAINKLLNDKGSDIIKTGNVETKPALSDLGNAIMELVSKFVAQNCKNTEKTVSDLAGNVNDMDQKWKTERKKRLKIESDMMANVVIINGVEFHPAALKDNKRFETPMETMQKTHEFLELIKVDKSSCGITEAIRLPKKQVTLNGITRTTNTIRVTFLSFSHKMALYKALAANGKVNKAIRVQDFVPSELIKEKRELEQLATSMRRKKPNLRTRVICRGGEMLLLTKDQTNQRYTKMKKETIEHMVNRESSPCQKNPAPSQEKTVVPCPKTQHVRPKSPSHSQERPALTQATIQAHTPNPTPAVKEGVRPLPRRSWSRRNDPFEIDFSFFKR